MSFSDPTQLFKVLQEKAQTQANGSGFSNPNILKLKRGESYSLRLLWLPSEERENPMINQYVHRIWDDNAVGSKDVSVICPTSQYDMDNNGFKSCPICEKMSALYGEYKNGSTSAKEIYDKFKRTLNGYVPVYVVDGPEADVGKVKILRYTISFKNFFDKEIFGLTIKKKDEKEDKKDTKKKSAAEEEIIGISAFMYYDPKSKSIVTKGYNLLITVGTKKVPVNGKVVEMTDYDLSFSRKESTITEFGDQEVTVKYFEGLSKELKFDEDFYKFSDQEALNNFKLKYIDGVEVVDEEKEEDEDEDLEEVPRKSLKKKVEVEENDEEEEEEEEKPVKKSKVVKEKVEDEDEDDDETDDETDDDGDDDVDEEEEEEEEKPVKKSSKKAKVEEDEDEEEDEPEEKPVKKVKKAVKKEEDDDEEDEKPAKKSKKVDDDDEEPDIDSLLDGIK